MPSVAFNCDGTKLAVGVSYTWDEGDEGAKSAERPAVFIRTTGDEVKVRISILLDDCMLNLCVAQGLVWKLKTPYSISRLS